MKNFVITVGMGLLFLILPVSAQVYKDTLWVPVTFFDFRSNGSNPEFECPHGLGSGPGGRHLNMVANTLDKDTLPVPGSDPYLNHYIKYWYRDWNDSAKGDNTKPVYTVTGGADPYHSTIRYDGITNAGNNTSFENRVIKDSLPFLHQGYGVYQYNNDEFFPLDGKGFGNEGKIHNYSFTMKLNWKFTKVPGLKFEFRGDDDVWAFIDGKLQMDIGGIHGAITDEFNLDDVDGLKDSTEYALDFFYAERHTSESHIRITTNIISAPPAIVSLVAEPDTIIHVGETVTITSTVKDADGKERPDYSVQTIWSVGGLNDVSTIQPKFGNTTVFTPTVAWTTDTIYGKIVHNGIEVFGQVAITVLPGEPHHLVVEATPIDAGTAGQDRLNNDTPLDKLVIGSGQVDGSAYAVLRDRYENFVKMSNPTSWTITKNPNSAIGSVESGNTSIGEGVVTKSSTVVDGGTGEVKATQGRFSDLLSVEISNVQYDSLRIIHNNVAITSLTTKTGDISQLFVQGHRTDGLGMQGGWVEVSGDWSMNGNFKANTPPIGSQFWNFTPSDTGTGTVSAKYAGKTATIKVTVNPGGPASLVLYPSVSGNEYSNPPSMYTVVAGTSFPFYAKVLDPNGIWLKDYDNSNAPITWKIKEITNVLPSPTGTLSKNAGHVNSFTPTRAYNVIEVLATFNKDGRIFSDSVRITTVPGAPHHITIQTDTASIIGGKDLVEISMSSQDTIQTLYALVRDKYENFISYAENSNWNSVDSNIVLAKKGSKISWGEGIVTRKNDGPTETDVVVTSEDNSLQDTITVRLMNITYDELRIFVLDNGRKYIDSVKIRTDEDTMLYVEGKRSDGKGWDEIPVAWSISGGLKVKYTPPLSSNNWNIAPDAVGKGYVKVLRTGAKSDSVVLVFLPGLPGDMQLYKAEGDPAVTAMYPQIPLVDTIQAGNVYPFVAKIFDRNGIWLSEYEDVARSRNLISWTIVRMGGVAQADTLDSKNGHKITFTPKKAYNTYQVIASFKENGIEHVARANVYVKPGLEDHLVIEASSTPTGLNLSQDNPLNLIEFSNKDTVKVAYAIIRDKFGNFITQSNGTEWSSVDNLIVNVNEGTIVLGEGRVIRTGALGETRVVAVNRNNALLFDTVDVKLSNVSYDSLRIVIDGSIRIDSLVVRSGQDTTIFVEGLRTHDQVWVSVEGAWSYTSNNHKTNANASGSKWDFAPIDTGRGIIVVTRGSSIPDTIGVRVNPGFPRKLAIYGKEGYPSVSNQPYDNPNVNIAATAGTKFPLVGKVFDQNGVWLPEYEIQGSLSKQITWRIEEFPGTDSSGFLGDTIGHKNSFTPVRAYQEVYLISQLIYNGSYLSDTVKLSIEPGEVRQLVLEGSADWQSSKNKPNPISQIEITNNMIRASVYAILRDSIGNYVKYSNPTNWGVVDDDTAVTVESGNRNIGEGIIDKGETKDDTAFVFAVDAGTKLRDTVKVVVLPYYYTNLRIILKKNGVVDSAVSLVTMTTNDDTTLFVQGKRSDTDAWVDASAQWEAHSSLKITPGAPAWSHDWEFSPADTGTGWIRVTLGNDSITTPDTIQVKFLPGPPTRVTIEIVTPPEKRIAGDSIITVIKIYNEDGLVPGEYCFTDATFSDKLGDGGRSEKPFILLGLNDTLWLDSTGSMCFNGGVDTVPLTLFYAPYKTDSLHQVTVSLGNLTTETFPFDILPAEIDSLTLEYQNGTSVPDTILLSYPSGQTRIYSVGYDKYGNKRGPEKSNWATDSSLHPITWSDNTDNIFYDASTVKENEAGNVSASVPHPTKELKASTFVRIYGPLTTVSSAITRDSDGNGYLDHIEIHFNKSVVIPDSVLQSMEIVYGATNFEIEGVIGDRTRSDSVWVIALKEEKNGKPQTSWTPFVSFNRSLEAEIESVDKKTLIDGAGPVVWKVTKEIKVTDDRTKDVVTVEFSEPVNNANTGANLGAGDVPNLMFYVWIQDQENPGNYIKIDSMLVGIENLQSGGDNVAVFTTSNNQDITARHFFSIQTVGTGEKPSYIWDRAKGNFPSILNQKVRVVVTGPQPNKIDLVPNPTVPITTRVPAGKMFAEHEPNARRWVNGDNAGTVISFPLVVANLESFSKDTKLRCVVKVYDIVGNMVNSDKSDDILPSIKAASGGWNGFKAVSKRSFRKIKAVDNGYDASVFPVDIYWNGYSKSKVRVAPGVYKVVVLLEYHGSEEARKLNKGIKGPMTGTVGIVMPR